MMKTVIQLVHIHAIAICDLQITLGESGKQFPRAWRRMELGLMTLVFVHCYFSPEVKLRDHVNLVAPCQTCRDVFTVCLS